MKYTEKVQIYNTKNSPNTHTRPMLKSDENIIYLLGTDKKRKENPAGKILGIISPSWIRPENFVDITGDIFISKTTREELP